MNAISRARRAATKYKNRISCHLITWGEDLDTAMREADELSYEVCETFTHQAMASENRMDEFEERLASFDLILSALYGGRLSEPAKADQVIRVQHPRCAVPQQAGRGPYSVPPRRPARGQDEPGRPQADGEDDQRKRIAGVGVLACVHHHLGAELQDCDELDAVMEMTDPEYAFFCPDTAPLTAPGMDVAEVIRTYGSRMRYMHLKDLTPPNPDPETFKGFEGTEALPICCEFGLGTIDFSLIVQAPEAISYDGWLTVEIDKCTSTLTRV